MPQRLPRPGWKKVQSHALCWNAAEAAQSDESRRGIPASSNGKQSSIRTGQSRQNAEIAVDDRPQRWLEEMEHRRRRTPQDWRQRMERQSRRQGAKIQIRLDNVPEPVSASLLLLSLGALKLRRMRQS
jgi:hypothetical protein